MGKKNNLIGKRFYSLTVIEESAVRNDGQVHWICRCDCGNITNPICASNLKKGHTKSCGCLRTRHGLYKSRLYSVWDGMKKRCFLKTNTAYHNYGGRGITVCDEWKDNFQAFYDWAMANGYKPDAKRGECTLDRIDSNGNYCPENCRWVDMKTQQNNRRNNIHRIGTTDQTIR